MKNSVKFILLGGVAVLCVLIIVLLRSDSLVEEQDFEDDSDFVGSLHGTVDVPEHVDLPVRTLDQNKNLFNHLPERGSQQYNAVLSTIARERYIVFSCEDPLDPSVGVMLVEKPNDSVTISRVSAAQVAVSEWEPLMLRELGPVLFPGVPGVASEILTSFETGGHEGSRLAKFSVGAQSYELHYGWDLSYVYFASSERCLHSMIDAVYSPGTH